MKNYIYKGKCETFTNWKSKRRYQQIYFEEHLGSSNVINFGPLVLVVSWFYWGDNGYEMQTSFKTLASENAAIWVFYKTSG